MELLCELGVDYQFQHPVRTRCSFVVLDSFVPAVRLCIEIDGPYYRAYRQALRDLATSRYLHRRCGFRVVRYRNQELIRHRSTVRADLRRRIGIRSTHATH